MAVISQYQVVIAGQIITAALWNGMELNIINNGLIPVGIEDYSTNDAQAQTQTDPYPAATLSKATDLAGEITRLRYQIAQILGETYWYIDADISLDTIKNSNVTLAGIKTFSSGLVITPTTNQLVLGTTNTTTISSVAPSASRVYTIPDAGGDATFVMSSGNTTAIFPAGSAAAPSVAVGDAANGLYRSGTNEVSLSTNGTQRIKLESDGDIYGTTAGARMAVRNTYNNIPTTSIGALDASASSDITSQNSKTFTLTFSSACQAFLIMLGGNDSALVLTGFNTSTITILGTTTVITATSTPASGALGIFKSVGQNIVSFKSGATFASGNTVVRIMSLSGAITAATDWA